MNTNKKYNHDLVTEDYYKQELEFQKNIDKEQNAKTLNTDITWKKTNEGILLTFPETLKAQDISGKVFLYRPSNKSFDFEMEISLSDYNLLIPDKRLLDGRWNSTIDWMYNETNYLYKKKIVY
jgi:hypothetical protein